MLFIAGWLVMCSGCPENRTAREWQGRITSFLFRGLQGTELVIELRLRNT